MILSGEGEIAERQKNLLRAIISNEQKYSYKILFSEDF
jgi:hypothetical protein